MIPQFQSRVGKRGRCFNACLASILEIPEASVPDFDRHAGTDYWKNVASFLAKYGLSYQRVSLGTPPVGWGTIEGISPRGGNHACVAFNGELVHDPHPQDGTGHGLTEPKYYGLLIPLRKKAHDNLKLIPNSKDGSQTLTYPKQVRTYRTWAERRNRAGVKDAQLDHYPMRQILDVLGIDIKEYMRRTELLKTQLLKTQLLKTALQRLTIPKRSL